MKFKPLGERALVRIVEREETTASGIVLPDTAKEKPQTAEVVEHPLELGDVRAPERGLAQVEEAPAGAVARLDDLAPGDRAYEPVGQEAQRSLEVLHGRLGLPAEDAVDAAVAQSEAEGPETGLEVHDLPSPISPPQR